VLWQLQRDHPDWELIGLDNFYLGELRRIGGISVDHVDIRDRDRLEDALAGSDVVLHLAAISGVDDCATNQELAYDVNVIGTSNVAWFCKKTETPLAFPFSMAVIGDPTRFPITVGMDREPLNWYGETKVLGERTIETLADDAFPAIQFMISNLYGQHRVNDRTVSKNTVINFFVDRAQAGERLTVYAPGSQARNFIHVKDVANAFTLATERLLDRRAAGETGAEAYEVASEEDPSVRSVAETVQRIAREEHGIDVSVDIVENPRGGETLVEDFEVDTTAIKRDLGWKPNESVETSIRELLAT
jgi:nucleoside-diphosphate-sugar epimerase